MRLETLLVQFDRDGDGALDEMGLLRLLRHTRPGLRPKQLERCLQQVWRATGRAAHSGVNMEVGGWGAGGGGAVAARVVCVVCGIWARR